MGAVFSVVLFVFCVLALGFFLELARPRDSLVHPHGFETGSQLVHNYEEVDES